MSPAGAGPSLREIVVLELLKPFVAMIASLAGLMLGSPINPAPDTGPPGGLTHATRRGHDPPDCE